MLEPVGGLLPGQEAWIQPSASTVFGAASEEPGCVSSWTCSYVIYEPVPDWFSAGPERTT